MKDTRKENKVCHVIYEGEILNSHKIEFPLLDAVLYGDKVSTVYYSDLEKRSSIFKALFFECLEDDIFI